MTSNIEGVLPILHTPFDVNDRIDRDSLGREIDWAFQQGVNGVCSAMVSEILLLTSEERVELNRLIVEMTAGRGNVVASVGAESSRQDSSSSALCLSCCEGFQTRSRTMV